MNDTLPGIPPAIAGRRIETTIHIDLLGKLWMGQPAAMIYTISHGQIKRGGDSIVVAGDLWIEDGVSELDAIDHWLALNTGDFREITATRITKVERAAYTQPVKDDDWHVSVHYTRETILRDFNEDHETEYNDCMYGGSDDD